jgi:RNA polymerase sigma-70 factor (ECF subfamily)
VVEANRAVAVAMAQGPAEGLAVLESVARHPRLSRWPQLHLAHADLLSRRDRDAEARAAYRIVLDLDPSPSEQAFAERRLHDLQSSDLSSER